MKKPGMTLGILLGGPKGKGAESEDDSEMEESEDPSKMPEGFESAAQQAFDAAKADDATGFASALHDAIRLCC